MGEVPPDFAVEVAPLRAELHAHCYRMLGSFHDADDAVQEAMVRAWRGLSGFAGRSSLRTWLYTVATRTCLDLVAARGRRALPVDLGPASPAAALDQEPRTDVAWLGPYPDHPEAGYERRESVELAFVAACQHLPGNQRAALLLFDVLGFSAADIAAMMDTTPTSVNSALARARRVIGAREPVERGPDDPRLRARAAAFATALSDGDTAGFVALLTEDVTWSMPPLPHWYSGVEAVTAFAEAVPMALCPSWRHRVTTANGHPAVAFYLGADPGGPHEAWSITVLAFRGDRVAAITSFLGAEHFAPFGLPAQL